MLPPQRRAGPFALRTRPLRRSRPRRDGGSHGPSDRRRPLDASGISRPRAAAVFKELRESAASTHVTLEDVIAAAARRRDRRRRRRGRRARERRGACSTRPRGRRSRSSRWDDERYPPLLRAIADPPPVLWARGAARRRSRGRPSRSSDRAPRRRTRWKSAARLAGELAERGVVVVSAGWRGAWIGARTAAASTAGGATVAVLGSGLDIDLSAGARRAGRKYLQRLGLLVSELGPGAPPLPEHFPLRNRLISGISLAVVVVEATEKSGSLITARCALEQGRDVMAVPGSVLGGRNRGSHALLKDGAKVVETADDILEELGWPAAELRPRKFPLNSLKQTLYWPRLTPARLYDARRTVCYGRDWRVRSLLPRLTEWETAGARW